MSFQNRNSVQNRNTQRFPGNVIFWFAILGLTIIFIPLFLFAKSLRDEVSQLEGTVVPLETAVSGTQTAGISTTLDDDLATLNEQIAEISKLDPTLEAGQINWPLAMSAIQNINGDVTLNTVSQANNQLIVRGQAGSETAVLNYAQQLENSGQFNRVVVQSIVVLPTATPVPPTTTPNPTRTAVPTATRTRVPTTPMPNLSDEFEWDNQQAKPIFLNAAQTHNFYPNFDVDNVTFLAKAGRFYQIQTSALSAGVDTYLTVTMGDITLTNDDAQVGTLQSLIELQAPAEQDMDVYVRITNRGVYGADKTYRITVTEFVPTPAPVEPTATPVIVSPTPDLRDAYEPDDPPTLLAVHETQTHSFFPSVDMDHLQLLVKAGNSYQIETSNLAIGVDTIVTLDLDRLIMENDDFDPFNQGNLESSICFSVDEDGVALIDIRNKSQQYEPDKTYQVSAYEVPFFADKQELAFGSVVQGPGLLSDAIELTSSEVMTWTAVSDSPWLQVTTPSGTTPATVNISVDTNFAPDVYTGNVIIQWENLCHQIIPVTIDIQPNNSADLNRPTQPLFKRARQQGRVEFVIVLELAQP